MEIPFCNLSRQYHLLREGILEKVDEVLRTGEYVLSHHVKQFEEEFAAYCRAKFAIGVNSGTDAMVLALKAIDIQKGDEVIVPASSQSLSAAMITPVSLISQLDPKA